MNIICDKTGFVKCFFELDNPASVRYDYSMMTHNHWVKETLAGRDIALLGFADLSEIDLDARRGFPYGVSIAMALTVLPSTSEEASIAYYDEYRRVSAQLKEASAFLTEQIQERGYNALSLWRLDLQDGEFRTPLPFKTLATRAGLGWIGKSAALITKEYGNAIRLGGVLTDMPLEAGTPVNESLCGSCDECVKHCPGQAIQGNLWDVRTDRDSLLDAHACKRAVIERGKALGKTEGTCGICIAVCPWTRRPAQPPRRCLPPYGRVGYAEPLHGGELGLRCKRHLEYTQL